MIASDEVALDYDSEVALDDQNAAEDGEIAPNTSPEVVSVNEDNEPPYTGNIDPVTTIPEWYRETLGDPGSWTDQKWRSCFQKYAGVNDDGADTGGTDTASVVEDIYAKYLQTLEQSASALSGTSQKRRPLNLGKLQGEGVNVSGIRHLVPTNEEGISDNPCLLIHEKRLEALLSLEASFRKLQRDDGSLGVAQMGLLAGLDVLAAAALNPDAEYERATLAAFDKLRSHHCRPDKLTEILQKEGNYSKKLQSKLKTDLMELIDLHKEFHDIGKETRSTNRSRRYRQLLLKERTDDYIAQLHATLLGGPDARVAAAHLGVNAYATNRQLYNLRLQHLSRIQDSVVNNLVAARESLAALVSQEQAVITNRVNEDLTKDLALLLEDRQKLSTYIDELEKNVEIDDEFSPERPALSHTCFKKLKGGMPNLMGAYASHSHREIQYRGNDDSLLQLRDWETQGVTDLSLIETLVARDPDEVQPGHDYQQLALDRQRLARNRLQLAERYQTRELLPKVPYTKDTMQEVKGETPFFQAKKGWTNNLRYHQPLVIPPAEKPSIFDEKMRMIMVNRNHYLVPNTTTSQTSVSTFSILDKVEEVQPSELFSRAHFPQPLDTSVSREEVLLKAATHEVTPAGFRSLSLRSLAEGLKKEGNASSEVTPAKPKTVVSLHPLGETQIQKEMNEDAAKQAHELVEAFKKGGFEPNQHITPMMFRLKPAAPGPLPIAGWPTTLPMAGENDNLDPDKYGQWYATAPRVIDWIKALPSAHLKFGGLMGLPEIMELIRDLISTTESEIIKSASTPTPKKQKYGD